MKKFFVALVAAILFAAPAVADTGYGTLIKESGGAATACVKVPLAAVDTAGGVFSWKNREARDVIVTRVVVNVTTKSTAASTVSIGQTPTSATTSSANLLDTLDVGTAAGVFDNVTDKGTLGKSRQLVAVGKWVTGSKASGATAGLKGSAYICYQRT